MQDYQKNATLKRIRKQKKQMLRETFVHIGKDDPKDGQQKRSAQFYYRNHPRMTLTSKCAIVLTTTISYIYVRPPKNCDDIQKTIA